MVTVEEALKIILQNCYAPIEKNVSITDAIGNVLSAPIMADRDFPPFHRVAMDGIAIAFDFFKDGHREFLMEDTQAAGQPVKKLKSITNCIEVMTGAVLPVGTDTVIRYEDLAIEKQTARISAETIQRGQHVHVQGQDARKGDVLVEPGTHISAAEIALLATVGMAQVKVRSLPTAAVVASGDELIDINLQPEPHQIRRSNTYAIQAAMKQMGWVAEQYHLPDEKEILKNSLAKLLSENDVIIMSGGVSKGKFDFVPEVLSQIGVTKLFHQVNQRPGKPFWFGVSDKKKVVFALPGNPVSTFMCFHKFIKPWLLTSLGMADTHNQAILASDFVFEPNLTYFLQVKVVNEQGRLIAYPKAGGGSGDFANLKEVDGFLELPADKKAFKTGEVYPYIPFRL